MSIVYALVSREKTVLAEYTSTSGNFPTVTRVLLGKIPPQDGKMSYVYDSYIFHYVVEKGMTYLCMTDGDENRRIPFTFLADIRQKFVATYGDRGNTAIAFAMNEEFQHVLRRQMAFFNDLPEEDHVAKLQVQLDSVRNVMVTNIEKVLERGEKIDLLVDRTDALNDQSIRFERNAKMLKRTMTWRKWKNKFCCLIFLIVVIYVIFASFCGITFIGCRSSSNASTSESSIW